MRLYLSLAKLSNALSTFCTTQRRILRKGPAKIAILGLLYWLFDELTVAQYLARRNYSTLAYTHLRSVMEILDKIELFTMKPETAELWASGNEREIRKKLSPPHVMEMLPVWPRPVARFSVLNN
jgi:hypothetical protein